MKKIENLEYSNTKAGLIKLILHDFMKEFRFYDENIENSIDALQNVLNENLKFKTKVNIKINKEFDLA